jgi:hypothetical protein
MSIGFAYSEARAKVAPPACRAVATRRRKLRAKGQAVQLIMGRKFSQLVILLIPLLLTSGCITYISVNVGNGTKTPIVVQSAYAVKKFTIRPGHFEKLPQDGGDLLVTVPAAAAQRLVYRNVAPYDVDQKYLAVRSFYGLLGPNWVTLNVILQTNLELYVLNYNKKALESQPNGYPKIGEREQ